MRLLLASLVVTAAIAAALATPGCSEPSCVLDTDCDPGFVCEPNPEDPDIGACTQACAADARCPGGLACVPREDGVLEGVCLTVIGAKEAGEPCDKDVECQSGACKDAEDGAVCVDTCGAGGTCADDANRCTLDGLRYVCVPPLDDKAAGEACADPRECLSGTCVVRPELEPSDDEPLCAEVCSDAIPCENAEHVCVRLEGGARACLEPLDDGAECQAASACEGGFCIEDIDGTAKCASACDAGACEDGFVCVKDEAQNDVCMPQLEEREDLEPCESARQCASGHCVNFGDAGVLCGSPCDDAGACEEPLVCYLDDNDAPTFCGPLP